MLSPEIWLHFNLFQCWETKVSQLFVKDLESLFDKKGLQDLVSFSQDLALCGTFVAFAPEHAGIEFDFMLQDFSWIDQQ